MVEDEELLEGMSTEIMNDELLNEHHARYEKGDRTVRRVSGRHSKGNDELKNA